MGECSPGRVARIEFAGGGAADDLVEHRRQAGALRGRAGRFTVDDLVHHAVAVVRGERQLAGKQLVHHDAQ